MNVPQEDLNGLAVLALRVKTAIYNARAAAPAKKSEWIEEAGHLAANLQTRLDRIGAEKPAQVPQRRYETPLDKLDTPANRAHMDALRGAYTAGLAVDRERYGEGIGTDGAAQVIEMVLADVEQEVLGPVGARD